jgi:hypothetical protein
MGEEQGDSGLAESWTFVREQRKRMQAQVVQLSALELTEFVRAARHMAEVAAELQAIAKYDRLPRFEDEARRFIWALERAVEAAEQMQLSLARDEPSPLPSSEVQPAATVDADGMMPTLSGVKSGLRRGNNSDNGRAAKNNTR